MHFLLKPFVVFVNRDPRACRKCGRIIKKVLTAKEKRQKWENCPVTPVWVPKLEQTAKENKITQRCCRYCSIVELLTNCVDADRVVRLAGHKLVK